ncbi:hypothetical protein AFCDBAGC_5155 [Methylobacterium cerastii]|uniref:Uncharacterized protein n=1 Tax=Methylobacterium cerastii TaxID=932741 RepID=A0ABQ4QPR7_9HYPH|nr:MULTISPECIES: hypothetical protein [Methylobacterium]GJD47262.1 hypothetical protein AFCDBAGC_5155 [Methylobacterium cerastii]
MLRLGRLDDAEDVAAFPVWERGRTSRMPSYIGAALLVLLVGDLLIQLLPA